ncbi:MAG: tetratricopeptide repeat protein [Candidatus Sumerlaeota bacterium]|nr:tetratricopeptide repeat protein [Candidatus Sumerlaeota bacterium]
MKQCGEALQSTEIAKIEDARVSHQANNQLPQALLSALNQDRLLVFCGAGASVLTPSCLPSWWKFNEALLEGAKEAMLDGFPGITGDARKAIQGLSLSRLSVETFSHKIVESFAGSSYFPLLEILESNRTNANHRAIAELARTGRLRAIVTTNFDTLIERAFREKGLGLHVIASSLEMPAGSSRNACLLLKIHGSVTAHTTLVDTVSQKLRGLPIAFRAWLAEQFEKFHMLVIGFSGADLNFGSDYLAFSAVTSDGPGITWVVRPGTEVSPRVADAVRRAGKNGSIIEADLPDFFVRLGVSLDVPAEATDADRAKREADDRIRLHVKAFYEEPHIGPFGAAALCLRLLHEIGDCNAADALHKALAASPEISGREIPIAAGAVFRWLAIHAMTRGRFEEAEKWEWREMSLFQGLRDLQSKHGIEPSAKSLLEMRQNLAGAWNNLSICALHLRKLEEAQRRNREAETQLGDPESYRVLCRVLVTAAQIADKSEASADAVLEKLRRAKSFALEAGEPSTLSDVALEEAKMLISVFELDGALQSLRAGRPYFRFKGSLDVRVQAAMHLATIARFRNRNGAGVEVLRRMRKTCMREGAETLALNVILRAVELFGACKAVRPQLVAELDALIAASSREAEILALLRDDLVAGKLDAPLQIRVRPFGANEAEQKIREQIAAVESLGRHDWLAELLEKLCLLKYEAQNFARLADLAEAMLAAAKRAHSQENRLSALNNLGIAREMLGDMHGAQEAYAEALAVQPPPSKQLVAFLKHNLALVEMRLANFERTETLLREALAINTTRGDYNNAANNIRFLAEAEARKGNVAKAIELLGASADIIERAPDPRIRPAIEFARRQFEIQRDALSSPVALQLPREAQGKEISAESLRQLREQMKAPEDLGNLGLAALQSGLVDEALELFAAAEAGYAAMGNSLGLSRCLSNRATAAASRGRWPEAIDLVERSIAIRRNLGDIDGEILNGSSLAMFRFENRQDEAAIAAAKRVITLSHGRTPAESLLKAFLALIMAHGRRGEAAEAKEAAKRFLAALPSIGNAAPFKAMLPDIQRLADDQPIAEPSPERLPPLQAAILEAERLQRAGDWREALVTLDALDASGIQPVDKAMILATRGNILQTGCQFAESTDDYAKASEIFQTIGQEDLALQADHHRAVSLRNEGKLAESETLLRCIWNNAPPGRLRAMTAPSLVNLLLQRITNADQPVKAPEIEDARSLLAEARQVLDLDEESRGIIEMTASNVEWLADNLDGGIYLLEKARQHLLRCNSRHVDACEHVLAQRRAALRERPDNDEPR